MKFLINPTQESLARARAPVQAFLAFAALLLAGGAVQRIVTGGLVPEELELTFRPDGPGREALASPLVWEEIHQGAFIYGFLVLMLGSLLVLCPVRERTRTALLWATFATVIADLLAPAGIALGLPGIVRVITFALATGTLFACLTAAWARFGRAQR